MATKTSAKSLLRSNEYQCMTREQKEIAALLVNHGKRSVVGIQLDLSKDYKKPIDYIRKIWGKFNDSQRESVYRALSV